MQNAPIRFAALAAACSLGAVAAGGDVVTVTFDEGAEGWLPAGGTAVEAVGGNPGAHWHTIFNNFGLEYRNSSNASFAFDWTSVDSVTIGCDLKVNDISFFGSPVTRPWIVEVRDFDDAEPYPWVSVWYKFDEVSAGPDYVTWSVTIDDTSATELPAGWGGYGAEDPETFEPILPPDRTFADVLAGADEIVFTTYEPGFFYGFTDFDLRIDNIRIETESGGVPGDVDGDGDVDFEDVLGLLASWGPCGGCPADFDGNGIVDFTDLLTLLSAWT